MIFSKYILILFSTLFLLYGIGVLTSAMLKHKANHFSNLFLGLILSVIVYAMIITSLKTAFTGVFVVVLVYIFYNRDKIYKIVLPKFYWQDLLYLLIPIAFFIYRYFFIFSTETGVPLVVEADNLFNSHQAMFINHTGKETFVWDLFNYNKISNTPYHYFEAWFIALTAETFNENYWFVLQLVCIPILQTILVIGSISFISLFSTSIIIKLLGFSLVFMSGFNFPEIENIHLGNWYPFFWNKSHWFNGFNEYLVLRLLVGYILYVFCLIELYYKRYFNVILFISVVPLFSVVIGVPALVGLFAIIMLAFIKKHISLKQTLIYLAPFIFVSLFFFVLYNNKNNQSPLPIPSPIETILSLSDFSNIRSVLILIFEDALNLFIRYSILLTILSILIYKNLFKLKDYRVIIVIVFGLISLIIGFLMRGILKDYMGAWEFSHYAFMSFCSPAIIISIIYLINKSENFKIKTITLICICVYLGYSIILSFNNDNDVKKYFGIKYSVVYYKVVKDILIKENYPIIAFFETPQEVSPNLSPFIQPQAYYLNIASNKFYFVSMSFADIDTNSFTSHPHFQFFKGFINTSPFYKFVEQNRNRNNDIATLQYDFIREHKIKYISVSALGVLSDIFKPYIKKQYKDEVSGEQFIVLKEY